MGNTLITIIGNDGERWQFRNDRSDAMREMRFWEMSQNPHYYTTNDHQNSSVKCTVKGKTRLSYVVFRKVHLENFCFFFLRQSIEVF